MYGVRDLFSTSTNGYYLQNGTRLVWLVYPEKQQIEIHTADAPIQTPGLDDALDGGAALPGLTLPLRDVFPA